MELVCIARHVKAWLGESLAHTDASLMHVRPESPLHRTLRLTAPPTLLYAGYACVRHAVKTCNIAIKRVRQAKT